MTERKLDIFSLLRAIDKGDGDWFARQPEDVRKEFAPVVVQRWAATVDDGEAAALMLCSVNERVNLHLFDLHKHPELVYRLLASCGFGVVLKHQWLAGQKHQSQANKAYALLEKHYPDANEREIRFLMSQFTKSSFSNFISDCGIQAAEAKEILKAYAKVTS